jgi:hypothetical protein
VVRKLRGCSGAKIEGHFFAMEWWGKRGKGGRKQERVGKSFRIGGRRLNCREFCRRDEKKTQSTQNKWM